MAWIWRSKSMGPVAVLRRDWGSSMWMGTTAPFAIVMFTPVMVAPTVAVNVGVEVAQWQGSRSPGVVTSAQAMYWPAGRVGMVKARWESAVTLVASGPVMTGGAVKWGAVAGRALAIRTLAPAIGLPAS